ncbi:hypothetical protein HPB48_004552 [Haemaphysalis longicornis]|uniref:Uncharacterized protein n=1 Tax=Haemaphysalis longicornis TaxID=44386 RepID=A0A9J6GUI3_HAELO|nr:hypothetical protein HPB48_004552 [Haemaphysalis longicornis]
MVLQSSRRPGRRSPTYRRRGPASPPRRGPTVRPIELVAEAEAAQGNRPTEAEWLRTPEEAPCGFYQPSCCASSLQEKKLEKCGHSAKAKTAQLVRTVAELYEAREKQAQLEKRVKELVTPAAGDDASARAQHDEWHAGENAEPQGATDAARTSGVRRRRADSGSKESPKATPGRGGSPARSFAAVVNHSRPRTPAKGPVKTRGGAKSSLSATLQHGQGGRGD